MLLDKLSEIIDSAPDILQFAKDRKYEEAWIIPKTTTFPEQIEIDNYLSKESFETIIVEYIWNSNDDDNRFVLTLFLDDKCDHKEPGEFVKTCLDLFRDYPGFLEFIKKLDEKVVGHEYLLRNSVDAVNLGVFNYWMSVGPVDLWSRGESFDMREIEKKIVMRPEVEKTNLNYQGLLFRFNVGGEQNGPYFGIKTPCCNKKGDFWKVDYGKLERWFEVMLGIGEIL